MKVKGPDMRMFITPGRNLADQLGVAALAEPEKQNLSSAESAGKQALRSTI